MILPNISWIWSRGGMMTKRWQSVLYCSLCVLCLLQEASAKKKTRLELRKQSTNAALFYVGLTVGLVVLFMVCSWCCRQLCPDGPSFSALDLDEIRLERLDDIEQSMKKQIRELQTQLNVHQKRKAEIEFNHIQLPRARDERRSLLHDDEEMGIDFESPQKQSATPYRRKNEDIKTPEPVSSIKALSSREEKEDEKDDDLWQLWNRMVSTTGKAKDKQEDAPVSKEYAYKSIKFERKAPPSQRSPVKSEAVVLEPITNVETASSPIIPKSKPPPPQSPPPSTIKKQEAVKVGTGAVVDDDYKINIGSVDHQYRQQMTELKPSASPLGPPVHKPSNAKLEPSDNGNVARRPPPPRGPPPGFRKPRPPPPKASSGSAKHD